MSHKLTKRLIESTEPPQNEELLLWDSGLKGFGCRVFPSGRKTYFVQYRNQFNRTRRKKIGVHGILTTEQAREEAKKILGDVAKGADPSAEGRTKKNIPTLAEFAKEYLEVYAKGTKREKSYKEDQRLLKDIILKRLGTKAVHEVT